MVISLEKATLFTSNSFRKGHEIPLFIIYQTAIYYTHQYTYALGLQIMKIKVICICLE